MPYIIQNLFSCRYLVIAFFSLSNHFKCFTTKQIRIFKYWSNISTITSYLLRLKAIWGFSVASWPSRTNNFFFVDAMNGKKDIEISLLTPALHNWPMILFFYRGIHVSENPYFCVFYTVQCAATGLLIHKTFISSIFIYLWKLIGGVLLTFLCGTIEIIPARIILCV